MATPRILKLDEQHSVNLANVFAIHYATPGDHSSQASLKLQSIGDATLVLEGELATKTFDYLNKNHFDAVKP